MLPMQRGLLVTFSCVFLFIAGCNGDYSGGTAGESNDNVDGGSNGSGQFTTSEAFFDAEVKPRLDFCRTCHVPGGVADTAEGERFLLSSVGSDDWDRTQRAWQALGEGVETNMLLVETSDPTEPHSGGKPWVQGSVPYTAMHTILSCWDDPVNCSLQTVGDVVDELPLLGSRRASHVWSEFCADQPDDAVLPPDPRSLVQPGFNENKAVYYNAFWQDCHVNLPEEEQQARTCGEYRARRDRGLHFLKNELPTGGISAEDFNNRWQTWGYAERPANFEELYTLRYGLNDAPFDNPYPLPGEDPNQTDGGSGQLPLGLRQLQDEEGNWTGQIGTAACFACHGGQIGDPFNGEENHIGLANMGSGNNNYDVLMYGQDGSPLSGTILSSALPPLSVDSVFNIGIQQRGQNNAVGAFEFLVTLLDFDSLGLNPNLTKTVTAGGLQGVIDVAHPLAHTQDTPPWWNMGMRPRKFFDAGVSNDSTRIIMAAGPGELGDIVSADGVPYRTRIEEWDQDLEAYFLSLESPPYPGEIDTELAEQGAILFHSKNLWAEEGNAQAPQPLGGNGSCASCHGVYSSRYAHDESYLEDPMFEGVAGHISPLEVIGTDPARSDMLTPTLRAGWDTTFWAYTEGVDGWTEPAAKDPLTELLDDALPIELRPQGLCGWQKDVIGYQAPPLYGVWATAPYFHNGSVPTLEQVFNSVTRPTIWQRMIQEDGNVKGFDQSLERAYDHQAVGWKHTVMACGDMPGDPNINCNPVDEEGPSFKQLFQNFLNGTLSWAGLITIPDPTPGGFDKRLVYDTRILGNGNGGHSFTDVLTEEERAAIIEYLKTL